MIAMTLRQIYYTSWNNPQAKRTGFQVKAQTPGIPPALMDRLNKLMGYRIPPSQTEQPADTHPVALRFLRLNRETAVLLCSQSNGADELGRPGNYFVHAVVGPAAALTELPPITYYHSDFWVRYDTSAQTELPPLESLPAPAAFDFHAAWDFIAAGYRRQWFLELLRAVVDGKRRIVILDDIDNVVSWIYALSLALPPRYRGLLGFTTYHHDPHGSPFFITGTTDDFTPTSGDLFVLNTRSGRVNHAPPSAFADYAVDHFGTTTYEYEETLSPLLSWLDQRDRQAEAPTSKLDDLTGFYLATTQGPVAREWPEMMACAQVAVADVQALAADPVPADAADLRAARDLIGMALDKTADADLVALYETALTTLQRIDSAFAATCRATVDHIITAILARQTEIATGLARVLNGVYPAETIAATVNDAALLDGVTLPADDLVPATLFWQLLGEPLDLARTTAAARPLVQAACGALSAAAGPDTLTAPEPAATLLRALVHAAQPHREELLRLVGEYQLDHPQRMAFPWVYYAIIERIPVAQRASDYWPRYWDQFPELYRYELQREIVRAGDTTAVIDLVAAWLDYVRADLRGMILNAAVALAWDHVDRRVFAMNALVLPGATELLQADWYERLVETSMADLLIGPPDPNTVALYEKFNADLFTLKPAYRAVIQGSLALYHESLDPAIIPALQKRFAETDAETYALEIRELIPAFFRTPGHEDMVRATYVATHREAFWTVYWETFHVRLLEKGDVEDMVAVLNFWFRDAAVLFEQVRYVVPEFFSQLLDVLADIRGNRAYKTIGDAFEEAINARDWADVVRATLQKRSRGLLGGLFER